MARHLGEELLRWAAEKPDHDAIRFADRRWSWAQWGERVRRNAAAQLAAGLVPGDRVAFLDKNHPACLETTAGCAMIGTVAALLNFRLAAEEYVYLLNDSRARLLIVGAEFAGVIESISDRLEHLERVVVVSDDPGRDQYEQWLAGVEPSRGEPVGDADDVVLQLYTSGTTGLPKGAMLTHRGVLAHSAAGAEAFGLDGASVSQVAMPLYHVGGTNWALIGLSVGGSVVIDREVVPTVLLDEMDAFRITHTFIVPAVLAVIVDLPGLGERDFSSLRVVAYGSSPITPKVLERSLVVLDAEFLGLYGMTETSGILTALPPHAHRDLENRHRLLSVGLPLPGVELRVVDPASARDVGTDEVGEVWVRSAQTLRGYHNKPEASAEALRADGWFRTGDAARRDADGYLYITDRVKDMIISGGENVYPAEVERVLSGHPAVAEVAVVGAPDDRWGEVPIGYVVAGAGERPEQSDLIDYARVRLAKFKCPAEIRFVDQLPRNPTGKVLKTELRKLVANR
jgi:acyl-CoA synthetase (AMP-forming)/AMP-acid ligase II